MFQALVANLLRVRTLLMLVGLCCLAILVWFVGPHVSVAGITPLAGAGTRVLVIAALFVFAIGALAARIFLSRRANARAIKTLLDSDGLALLASEQSSDEVEIIRERFESAMRTLKEQAIGNEAGRNYMIQLPWYVILGPPGAGKTTILKNSGLNFPLADRVGDDPVAGIGGTRYCDWWFTDEAVLIDTAGRYTTQDVNSEVDKVAWRGFLELLRTHRPRRPINGVIIAISLADVISTSDAQRKVHADHVKRRLQELMRYFGMTVPVYVLITKCDLLSGFGEYFGELDDVSRAQVWGMTFPLDMPAAQLEPEFRSNFLGLVERLEGRLMRLLHQERALVRRCRMFNFPKEFASLSGPLGHFTSEVFKTSRFEMRPILRGLYFTSGTQAGAPVERLLGAMSRNFGLSGGARRSQAGIGKTFFVKRLLSDVIFDEQGLVGVNRKLERSLSTMRAATYVGAAAVTLGLSSLWISSASQADLRIGATRESLDDAERLLRHLPPQAGYGELLPLLNAGKALTVVAGIDSSWISADLLGLPTAPRLGAAARNAYDQLLVTRLLPAFAARLEGRIAQDIQAGTPAALEDMRTALTAYLMLGEPKRFERSTMLETVNGEAVLTFPLDTARQKALAGHLDALVGLMPQRYPLNTRLIEEARARLSRVPQVDQVYARLLREGYQNQQLTGIDLAQVMGTRSLAGGAQAQASGALAIPGVFTRAGFYNFFLPRLPVLVSEALGGDWVVGTGDKPQSQALARQIAALYVRDYIAAWQGALSHITAIRFDTMPQALGVLQNLAGPQSPLDALVAAVKENTDLPAPGQQSNVPIPAGPQPAPSPAVSPAGLAQQAAGAAGDMAAGAAFGEGPWPGKTITQPFIALIQLGTPGASGQAPALSRVRDLVSNVYGVLSGVANAPQPPVAAFQIISSQGRNQGNDAFTALRTDSALRPEPVRTVLTSVTDNAWATLLGLARDNVNQAWKQEVLPVCESAIARRYPVYGDARDDITLSDFTDFFRPGGTIDSFFQQYLAPFVTDRRGAYVPLNADGARTLLNADTLAQFNRARQIREAFFPNKGPTLLVKYGVRPIFLSPNVLRATLSIDGTDIVYRHEAPRTYDMEWPTKGEASTLTVTLTPVEGRETQVQRTGPWALFRFVSGFGLRSRGDIQSVKVQGPDGQSVTYEFRAASVNSAFALGALRGFRCPDEL
ncbi:type VI secretion system membrane subunit TssM [Xanthobacter agilis]|uniref:Type VI secretion system protein ImpL n=1 Tax=Xanthobacter agilis TaxID=47492 RepID=A0ABU0LEK7_XANAG|nr:type VI secretion system membrane subunit TssM [Xanthobacter agilis]MDQ0505584.1 type VI secretion system protein ImpL [Xanthobacter agilis]